MKASDQAYMSESQVPTMQGIVWTMGVVPLLFVGLRLYVRIVLKSAFGWDDFIIIIALGCLIAYAGVCQAAASIGLGRHLIYVEQRPNDLISVALLCDIGESLAIMACTLGKTSFAVTLLRIVVQRWMVVLLWFVIITMNIVNILAALFVFVQCEDPRHLWNEEIPSKCWPADTFTNFSLFVGAYSGAQDFVLALLPWKMIWKLQMKRKEKIGIAIAMSLGVFAGVASIVKTTYLVNLSAKVDFTWELAPLLYWAAIEDGLAITAASIPALKPLLGWALSSSLANENYSMIIYPPPASKQKVFDNSQGETLTQIQPVLSSNGESQASIPEAKAARKDNENINLTTSVSVTYSRPP